VVLSFIVLCGVVHGFILQIPCNSNCSVMGLDVLN